MEWKRKYSAVYHRRHIRNIYPDILNNNDSSNKKNAENEPYII